MLKRLAAGFLALSLLFSACGSRVEQATRAINQLTGIQPFETIFGEKTDSPFSCTAFYIDTNTVLTANHCITESKQMKFMGKDIIVLKTDDYYDLAAFWTEIPNSHPLAIRQAKVHLFEPLMAIGYAFGWEKPVFLKCYVMSIGYIRPSKQNAPGIMVSGQYVKGMSGGPVLDVSGQVVSVIQQGNDGVGYGVPSILIKAFLIDVTGE